MLVSRYSKPEFDPYDNDDLVLEAEPGPWPAPTSAGPLTATLSLPGSKSLTNRELVLSALAEGPSLLRSPLHSRDTALMIQGLRELGVSIVEQAGTGKFGADLVVTPGELSGGTTIDCGLAGTVMRFLPAVAALALGPVAFDGDPSARKRPMRPTIDALRALGVDVNDDNRGTLPFSLYGTGSIAGGQIDVDASGSSQFISSLLLVAARFETGITLRHLGDRVPSDAHITMTTATLAARGVEVDASEPDCWKVKPGPIAGIEVEIEPDLSNASPFLAAALVTGGSVTISGWPSSTTQLDAQLRDIMTRMGGTVSFIETAGGVGNFTVTGSGSIQGVRLDNASELTPTVAALAALADSETVLTGIAHLRGHETDRLKALATEINALGGDVTETDDGLIIRPAPLRSGLWHSYEDHRMATAGAIIGLRVPEVEIDDIATTAKTLPEFPELWQGLVHGISTSGNSDPLSVF